MSSLQQLFTSRKPYNASTFIAGKGKVFYDEISGALRIGDGVTPGGSLISYPVASPIQIGGIKLGPGVVLNSDDQIIIDSTGLDFSFGDLASTIETYTDLTDYAVLKTINDDEDLVLASNGAGGIHIVGEFRVHATNGGLTATLESTPAFEIKADGQVTMLVPALDSTEGAVNIVGSATGLFLPPVNTGVMLHITGQYDTPAIPSRLYNDAQGSFAAFVARRYNGTVASPTAVLADEELMRISGTAHNGTTIPGTGNQRIVYKALGNQTLTNQGGYIELWTTPLNSTTIAKVATINNVDGITATKFTGPLTGNVTGTATTATYAQSFNTGTLVSTAVLATTATNAAFAYSFNTGTLVSTAVLATTATNAAFAYSFNTGTLVANAVSAQSATTAGTVTTAAQPAITSVGTLTSLTVTNLVTAKTYAGQSRNAGTLGAGGTLTIDFATDHNVLVTLTTTAVIAFSNITAGKTVTVLVKNATGANRAVTTGVLDGNTSGGNAAPNVNDDRTGVFVYRTFGTATTDIYCEVNP